MGATKRTEGGERMSDHERMLYWRRRALEGEDTRAQLLEALRATSRALFDAWAAQQAANAAGRPGSFQLDMGAYEAARADSAAAEGK